MVLRAVRMTDAACFTRWFMCEVGLCLSVSPQQGPE